MIKKLGYVVLGTSDLDTMVQHYTASVSLTISDRDSDVIWLSVGAGAPCLGIERGGSGLLRTGLQLAIGIDEAEDRLTSFGVETTRRGASAPGLSDALTVTGPAGNLLELYENGDESDSTPAEGLPPRKLGHVATFVDSLDSVFSFYGDGLGLRWADTVEFAGTTFFTFMRCGPDHHTMNFMENPQESGLHHFAFEARDIEHLKHVCDQFARTGVTLDWGIGRHGPGHNIFTYHRDPDGNLVEVFTDLDVMLDEESGAYDPRPWHEDSPQRPKVWQFSPEVGNTWGPGPADPEFLKTPAWIGEAIAAAQASS